MCDKIDTLPTNEYEIPSFDEVQIMKQLFKPEEIVPINNNLKILKISSYLYILYTIISISSIKLSTYFNNYSYSIYQLGSLLFLLLSYVLLSYIIE